MRHATTALAIVVLTIKCLMLVLGFLVIADAHHNTAAGDGPAHAEGTCEAGPAELQGGVQTLAISGLQPTPSPMSHTELSPIHAHAYSPATLERLCVLTGNYHQSKLHCFVHVFLF